MLLGTFGHPNSRGANRDTFGDLNSHGATMTRAPRLIHFTLGNAGLLYRQAGESSTHQIKPTSFPESCSRQHVPCTGHGSRYTCDIECRTPHPCICFCLQIYRVRHTCEGVRPNPSMAKRRCSACAVSPFRPNWRHMLCSPANRNCWN